MHLAKRRTLIFSILLIAGLLAFQGCAANGYITAAVQSVIGLDVSENPQTQVPHVRFGFIRNQLYYLPTGKVSVGGSTPGSANETPVLVSDIDVDSEFLKSIKIKERFAVGKEAVGTPAAAALFNPEGRRMPPGSAEQNRSIREIGVLIQDPAKKEKAKTWIKKNYSDYPYQDPDLFLEHPPGIEPLINLLQELKKS